MRAISRMLAALAFLTAGSLALHSGCSRSHQERVVSVGQDELTVANEGGEASRTRRIAPDAKIVLDGEPAELAELEPGDSVRVTTAVRGDQEVVVGIDAERMETAETPLSAGSARTGMPPPRSGEERAAALFRGEIVLLRPDLLRLHTRPDLTNLATEVTFTITEETKIFIAGEPADSDELDDGMIATVTTTRDAEHAIAERIDIEPTPL